MKSNPQSTGVPRARRAALPISGCPILGQDQRRAELVIPWGTPGASGTYYPSDERGYEK
jgi:hypothetical protein